MTLENMANKVAANMPGKNGAAAAIDPSMIPVIIDIVSNLVTLFKKCNKTPGEALIASRNPGRREKMALNSAVRRHVGLFRFRREGNDIIEAIKKTGSEVTESEIDNLYNEV